MGRAKEAEEDYRKAINLNAKNIDALFRVGVIASRKGDKDIADQFSEAAGCASQR